MMGELDNRKTFIALLIGDKIERAEYAFLRRAGCTGKEAFRSAWAVHDDYIAMVAPLCEARPRP